MRKILIALFAMVAAIQFTYGQWNTDRILSIGRNAYYYEDYVLSIQYFNQAIKIKPYLPEPYMFRGMAKISLGDYIGAEQDGNEAIRLNPFVPYAYYTRGFARKNLKKYDESIQDFTKALEFDPDNSNYLANRIEAKEQKKDFEGAISDLRYFKKVNPKAKGIEYEIGRIMLANNDTLGAEEMVKRNIEIDSTMELAYKLLAHIKEQKNDIQGAIESMKVLKKINPKSENLDLELGRLYLANKDTSAAIVAFDLAILNDPRKPHAFGARAFLAMIKNAEDDAHKDYSKAIENGSEFAGDYINRGILNVKRYKFNQALNDYNFAILLDRNNSLAYYNRALLRNNLGDKNNALSDLQRVLELNPDNYEAILQQANLQLELGLLDEAIENFEIILKRYKYFANAYYSIAEAYNKKGNKSASNNYRSLAFEIINNKDYYKRKQSIEPKNQIVRNVASQKEVSTNQALVDKLASNPEDKLKKSAYNDNVRGNIQDNFTELTYAGNAECSFEDTDSILSATNRYHSLIHLFNQTYKGGKKIRIAIYNRMINPGSVQPHFEHIELLNKEITSNSNNANLYFSRAIEFATVQDFSSALEDINKSIEFEDKYALAYFIRANIRVKLDDIERNTKDLGGNSDKIEISKANEELSRINNQKILADYDKAIAMAPNFSFAYYNKANFLAKIKDFRSANLNYSKAIELDPNFAEAYFGRGLSSIFLNEEEPAKYDLSKAGELGVYRAYNLLNRLLTTKDK